MQLSLANKYRPQTFDSMIGQQHIIGILKAKMQSNRDSLQNYLLTGPRGTGKTTSARILAKAINCLDPQDGNPCNHCVNCQTINENKTLDYVEIDAASHTGVDNIREEILDKALYPPTVLKKKIYVIDEVHMLSKGAFNSLLKTIEEPKGNVCFILATTEIQKVPDTIVSRCQTFLFRKVSEQEIADHLEEICKTEGFEYEKDALQLIAMISDGGVRDSIKYLDQVSILGKITTDNVSKFL
ncbi:DNA polymerase III subunit gamma/tau [bacterium]|nr:DNA polymerase III subunit gamma/tau [bacterium]